MKRLVYGIVAAGLAVGLVGCGESGGGYWPASPVSPATGGQVQPLGGDATNNAKAALGLDDSSVAAGGAVDSIGVGIAACPALSDFGISLPSSIGGTSGIAPFASIRGATKKRTLSEATTAGLQLAAATSDYVKFTASKSYTYGSYSYTFSYDWNVKFLGSDGKALAMSVDSARTDFWAFSGTGVSMASVSSTLYYGTVTVAVKSSGSSSSTSCDSSVCSYDYSVTGTMGSSSDPCMVGNQNGTDYVYVKSNGSWALKGSINGTAYSTSVTNAIYGDSTYSLSGTSYPSMFKYAVSTTSGYNFGYGTQKFVTDGVTVKMVAAGTSFSYYVNDTLVFTYPTSTSSTSQYK